MVADADYRFDDARVHVIGNSCTYGKKDMKLHTNNGF